MPAARRRGARFWFRMAAFRSEESTEAGPTGQLRRFGGHSSIPSSINERQRSELLRQPTWNLLWERLVGVFPEFRVPNLAYAGVAAAAVVLSTFILVTQKDTASTGPGLALNDPRPTVNVLPPGSGDIRFPVSSRSEFPPHYVLEARPVSYESPYSF